MIFAFLIIEPLLRWILSGLLLVMGLVIIRKLLRSASLSRRQRNVKLALNILLFLLAVLFLFQPGWPEQRGGEALLVYDAGIPAEVTDSVRVARKIKRSVSYKTFSRKFSEYAGHRFLFLGQEAEPQLLSNLAGKEVQWIPYFAPGALQEVEWKGILRKGERQTVSGKTDLARPGKIKLVYGEKVLDSLSLQKGFNAFRLSFPVFAEGRNVISLQMGGQPLQDITFYAQPAQPLAITMLLDNPDFESRILAEWLGARGHHVEISTPVARSVLYESRVNKAPRKRDPDLVIATPAQATDGRVRKAVAEGRNVLFFSLEEVPGALSRINRATGTAFSARRTTAQENLPLKNGLTALPYQLNPRPNQRQVGALPVSFQKNGAKVAVSLMNETFPARLSGDTLTYAEIWTEVIESLSASDTLKIPAPVFKDVPAEIVLQTLASSLLPDKDTLFLSSSPVNAAKKTGNYTFTATGWKTLYPVEQPAAERQPVDRRPVGEIYVEDSPLASAARWKTWLNANETLLKAEVSAAVRSVSAEVWFWVFFLCLAALWVEAKFRY